MKSRKNTSWLVPGDRVQAHSDGGLGMASDTLVFEQDRADLESLFL